MGVLSGLRVVEMGGIGPGPYAAMLLSDMGAEVIRVDRPGGGNTLGANPADILNRGRQAIAVNLKDPQGVEIVLKLVERADILIEGFRPGVMEKLGLGPDVCLARNPKLAYGRMTGWGQEGPLSQAAGHDINYIALTGALSAIGRAGEAPVPPMNLLGDFGGGALFLVTGLLAAVIEASRSGKGQVVDAAITDGVISLMTVVHGFLATGLWQDKRGENILDGGAPFYDCYQCADGEWVSVGAIEPHFFAQLLQRLELPADISGFEVQFDRARWPALRAALATAFSRQPRSHWCSLLEGTDTCFAPVLSIREAADHPHNRARQAFIERDGVVQSAPAPRFSRTPSQLQGPPVAVGAHTEQVLQALGYAADAIEALKQQGAVAPGEGA